MNQNDKLVVFDLDGVLIDSRDTHFEALNYALRVQNDRYVISINEHLSIYDGLSTTEKLRMLNQKKGLPESSFQKVWKDKQEFTYKYFSNTQKDLFLIEKFKELKFKGYFIAIASNSIRKTILVILEGLGISKYVDLVVSNEDVKRTKPSPEMYWKCMMELGCHPHNTVILEDSHIGREAAILSGAHLIAVENRLNLTDESFEKIDNLLSKPTRSPKIPWRSTQMNVLIPMAGGGTRFALAGYTFPKPLIEVNGRPMIQVVVENLNIEANYIFIVQKEQYIKYNLQHLLRIIAPNCKIIQVEGITEGAACTTLLAKELIDNSNPLVIANSDQFVEWESNKVFYSLTADKVDAGIVTFNSIHPKWSYAKLGEDGFVSEVAEKKPISDLATVGIYYWKHGSDYVKYAQQMINKNIRVNNEFYVCPVFNEAIQDGKKIKCYNVDEMWGLGTPEDLNAYLKAHSNL